MRAEAVRTWVLVVLAVMLGACTGAPSGELIAWSGRVDAALVAAETARAAGDRDGARARLVAALDEASPEPEAPLALALRENLWFALGRVQLEAGGPEEALAAADRGLALREDPASATVFTASLHALRALALERLSRPDDAIRAWEAAQIIHTRLFERALAARQGETP